MKKTSLKIALRLTKLSIGEKIQRARYIVDHMLNNGNLFPNPNPSLGSVSLAINDLEFAWNDALDGGKNKTAIMHLKEDELMKKLNDLAAYVLNVADGNPAIVIASGFEIRKQPNIDIQNFSVTPAADRGAVRLRVKARSSPKTVVQMGVLHWLARKSAMAVRQVHQPVHHQHR